MPIYSRDRLQFEEPARIVMDKEELEPELELGERV